MALQTINTADADLTRVQKNVKAELDRIEATIPISRAPSTKVTADYTVQLGDSLVLCGPQMPAQINITLPFAASRKGLTFTVKNISAAGTVLVRGQVNNGAREPIDGQAMPSALAASKSVTCYSDGAAWWVI